VIEYQQLAGSAHPQGIFTRMSLLSGLLRRELANTGEISDHDDAKKLFEQVKTILASQPKRSRRRDD
jgi:hypothetical protein